MAFVTEKELILLLETHSPKYILSNYKLTATMCVKYMIEDYITWRTILLYQSHLTKDEIFYEIDKKIEIYKDKEKKETT